VAKGPGGIISGGFQPLKAPDAPTIDSVSAGVLSAEVTVSAPTDAGEGTITSYVVSAKQGDGTSVSNTASAAGTVSLTLTAGGTTTFAAQAISEYGPGAFSGYSNSTSVFSGQELYAWGYNGDSRLGVGGTADKSSPVQVGSDTDWNKFSAGKEYHIVASQTDGTLWAWGTNNYGSLGLNLPFNAKQSFPGQLGALTDWSDPSAGFNHTLCIKTDGTLWAWGNATGGLLGNNTNSTDKSSPIQVGVDTNWSKISAAENHSLAILTSGELYAWGPNTLGQLGQNNVIARSSPVQIGVDTNWSKISAGKQFSAAIKTDNTLWTWGDATSPFGASGQLGHNDAVPKSSPVQVGSLSDWADVSCGDYHTVAVKTDGTLWAWGYNANGPLGQNDTTSRSSPVQIGALTNWSKISAGTTNCFAIKTDGTLWAWGQGSFGKLGDNAAVNRLSPVQIGALTTWSQVSGSDNDAFGAIGITS